MDQCVTVTVNSERKNGEDKVDVRINSEEEIEENVEEMDGKENAMESEVMKAIDSKVVESMDKDKALKVDEVVAKADDTSAVSYTHLTLPTILLV